MKLHNMIIIYNDIIPFKGFKAINICGIIFARKCCKNKINNRENRILVTHEQIHTKQIYELLIIGFYLWYVIEWLIKFIKYKNFHTAYKNISFEREAYYFQNYPEYLDIRQCFDFLYFINHNH